MSSFAIWIGLGLLLAGYVGWFAGRQIFCGGWDEHKTHRCGWFEQHSIANSLYPSRPCPRCGEKDNQWTVRVGRPLFPFGWEWKDKSAIEGLDLRRSDVG
jgi:hypothetical protein